MRRPATLLVLLATALVALSGCALLPHPKPVVDDPRSSTGDLPARAFGTDSRPGLSAYYGQHLAWQSCAKDTQCARFTAPLDWWHDRGGDIDLFVARHRATGKKLGTLVVDPGGPGASGANAIAAGVTGLVTASVARHYDVVGIDPRGVGYSTAVKCGGRKALDGLFYSPTPGTIGSDEWISAVRRRSATFAEGCRERSGALLDHVDSVSASRDLELLRRVLREDRLDYLGYSYGTSLGQFYAGMFPDRVGRMVLDAVEDPWYSGDEDAGQAGGFENEFDAFLRGCLTGATEAVGTHGCPYSGDLAAAHAAVVAELEALRTHPVDLGDGRWLTDQVLATGIDEALYSPESWPRLTAALGALREGRTTGIVRLADEYYGRDTTGYFDNGNESFLAINCLDYGSGVDLKADARELKELRKDDPVLGAYGAYGDLGCAGWHEPRSPFPAPVTADGARPILVVGTVGDPATPYPQARSVAKRLDSGTLVTYRGDGHGAYDSGSRCIDEVVDDYLLKGAVPSRDPHCRT